MKLFSHKILSLAMVTLVLFTTMSFAVDMHFCGEMLVDFSLTQNAHACGMEKNLPINCNTETRENSCCTDRQVVIEGQDQVRLSVDQLNFENHTFVATAVSVFIFPEVAITSLQKIFLPDYDPPIIERDLNILYDTFLI